jgi:multiple sugar transport system permease protein
MSQTLSAETPEVTATVVSTTKPQPQRRRRIITPGRVLSIGVLLFFGLIFFAPFVWLFLTAIKTPADLGAFPVRLLPSVPQWQNFVMALTTIDFARYAFNSFFLAAISAVLSTITSAMVGFAFARLRGVGKSFWFLLMLSTLMLPTIVTVIPTYVIYARLGMIGTYWPWVFGGLASSPFLSFLFRQSFSSIPQEMEDAAIVDGANYFRIFWQIFLPVSAPVIATSVILSFTGVWGDYLTPALLLNSDNTTLSVAMTYGYTDSQGNYLTNLLAAGTIFYILPVLVIFFVAQRYFIRGIVTTGLK